MTRAAGLVILGVGVGPSAGAGAGAEVGDDVDGVGAGDGDVEAVLGPGSTSRTSCQAAGSSVGGQVHEGLKCPFR